MRFSTRATLTTAAMLLLSGCMATRSPIMNSTELTGQDFSDIGNAKTGDACQKLLFGSFPIGKEKPSLKTAITKAGISNLFVEIIACPGMTSVFSCHSGKRRCPLPLNHRAALGRPLGCHRRLAART